MCAFATRSSSPRNRADMGTDMLRDIPTSAKGLSRRRFLQVGATGGGGLLLSFYLSFPNREAEAASAASFTPNAFIRIGGDGQIVLIMPYVEMGQGTYTSIPMLIAEELEVDLKQVRLEHAPANEKLYANPLLGVQATGNSNAMRGAWKPLARSRCERASHARGGSGKAMECRSGVLSRATRRGAFTHRPGGRSGTATLPPTRRACRCRKMSHSSVRRTSSSSASRRSVSTRRRRSMAPPSTASTSGRRASSSRRSRNRPSSAVV